MSKCRQTHTVARELETCRAAVKPVAQCAGLRQAGLPQICIAGKAARRSVLNMLISTQPVETFSSES
jgi:hypothetical protein